MKNKYPTNIHSFDAIYLIDRKSKVRYWFYGLMALFLIILFLPWTQNIKSKGQVTTLYPEQRPQKINSPIPGKIVKWYVREGNEVNPGDTLLQLAEIKPEYLDPQLVERTQEQMLAKQGSIDAYENKIGANIAQGIALESGLQLKIKQIRNKIQQTENKLAGEQAELQAMTNDADLARDQYQRQEKMFAEGLVSQTQLQQRNAAYQNILAKKIGVDYKVQQTRQELMNLQIEINSLQQDYAEKLSKVQGEQYSTMSQIQNSQAEVSKLKNQVQNYKMRNQFYYVLAPQAGQVVQVNKAGIGEILKEEEYIMKIVPARMKYAVEMYIKPVDLPLIDKNQKVRFMFDGFPAIVFSGWPNNSYGTFGGKIVAYENTIGENGMFRVLVTEDEADKPWPAQLRVGSGAQCITLLKDVPIWYELWRNINGFPPDYYKVAEKSYTKNEK